MTGDAASPMPPREAYGLWAPTYDEENVLSTLDELATSILTPPLGGLTLLDAACGTARRLVFDRGAPPRLAAGVDLVLEMLLRSRGDPRRSRLLAVGDVRNVPLAKGAFDVVWCRLAAGHVGELEALYAELSRAARPGGFVIVTDFHPVAVRSGHVRSFRDASGTSRVVENAAHEPQDHEAAARRCGLSFDARIDLPVGLRVRRFYEAAGALSRFERDRGLPLLLAFRFRR